MLRDSLRAWMEEKQTDNKGVLGLMNITINGERGARGAKCKSEAETEEARWEREKG